MMKPFMLCCVIVLLSGLTACVAPTPVPTPTVIPTEPPILTPVSPTATSIPTNTHTPVPLTETPEPTATPRPTDTPAPTSTPTKAATKVPVSTPKPAATQSVAAPARVSSQPSSVLKSIQQAFNVAQVLNGRMDALLQGDAALCAPVLESFNSLINAPVYDVSTAPTNVQQAYGLYRGAIDQFSKQANVLRACGAGGVGTISKLEFARIRGPIGEAANRLAQAWELVRYDAGDSTVPPQSTQLLAAVRQSLYNSDALDGLQRLPREWKYGMYLSPYPVKVAKFPCGQYSTFYQRIVNAPTFDANGHSPSWQAAYTKYREAVAQMVNAGRPIFDECQKQEGLITTELATILMQGTSNAHELYSQAIQLLSQ